VPRCTHIVVESCSSSLAHTTKPWITWLTYCLMLLICLRRCLFSTLNTVVCRFLATSTFLGSWLTTRQLLWLFIIHKWLFGNTICSAIKAFSLNMPCFCVILRVGKSAVIDVDVDGPGPISSDTVSTIGIRSASNHDLVFGPDPHLMGLCPPGSMPHSRTAPE